MQRKDSFTTGIVYMPVGLVYVAAALRASDTGVMFADTFAETPRRVRRQGGFCVYGLRRDEVLGCSGAHCEKVGWRLKSHVWGHFAERPPMRSRESSAQADDWSCSAWRMT